MIFTYKKWENFCRKLKERGRQSIPACEVTANTSSYLVLKHDVETNVPRAYKMAQIEQTYGHRGSYYVQAYLLENESNIKLLAEMQAMGHEISYHYDVMDSCHGNMDDAMAEFEKNRERFEQNGFAIKTVCQHGNPVVERVGYTSNRDFFRSDRVRARYPQISDIMVNYKEAVGTDYLYFSDAGRIFKQIYDPLTNDLVNSDDKNIPYQNLNELLSALSEERGNIVSTHPHRWCASALLYTVKACIFRVVKAVAKLLIKIPFMKKFMGKYYHLAKKF